MTFFSSLVVPFTPPSLVKFKRSASGVMTGESSSVPSSDHVPELRKAVPSRAEIAATAEPVSWQAGAITVAPASEEPRAMPGKSVPTIDPGSTIGAGKCSREFEPPHQVGGPRALHRIDHLCGRCIGEFADCVSREPIIEEVRNRQHARCSGQKLGYRDVAANS